MTLADFGNTGCVPVDGYDCTTVNGTWTLPQAGPCTYFKEITLGGQSRFWIEVIFAPDGGGPPYYIRAQVHITKNVCQECFPVPCPAIDFYYERQYTGTINCTGLSNVFVPFSYDPGNDDCFHGSLSVSS